jgi:hypothetical protein
MKSFPFYKQLDSMDCGPTVSSYEVSFDAQGNASDSNSSQDPDLDDPPFEQIVPPQDNTRVERILPN